MLFKCNSCGTPCFLWVQEESERPDLCPYHWAGGPPTAPWVEVSPCQENFRDIILNTAGEARNYPGSPAKARFSRATGISPRTLERYLDGSRNPSGSCRALIALMAEIWPLAWEIFRAKKR